MPFPATAYRGNQPATEYGSVPKWSLTFDWTGVEGARWSLDIAHLALGVIWKSDSAMIGTANANSAAPTTTKRCRLAMPVLHEPQCSWVGRSALARQALRPGVLGKQ